MRNELIAVVLLLPSWTCFASDAAKFTPYNGRVLSYQELSSASIAVTDFVRRVVPKHYDLYSENGALKIDVLFADETKEMTCVVVMSARSDVRGGAGEYCVNNKTKKVTSFRLTK